MYTKRIQDELGICKEKYSEYIFREYGLAVNLYKGCEILLLPKDILHELPIAQCWDDMDRVASENENIRREINEAVGEEWSKRGCHFCSRGCQRERRFCGNIECFGYIQGLG